MELYKSSIVMLVLDESGPDPQLLLYLREPPSFAIRDWSNFCNRQRQALCIETHRRQSDQQLDLGSIQCFDMSCVSSAVSSGQEARDGAPNEGGLCRHLVRIASAVTVD